MEALSLSRRITDLMSDLSSEPAPRTRAWDGSEWGPSTARATLVLRHPSALRAMLIPPRDLTAGEAYVFDDVDVEGDMFAMLEFAAGVDVSQGKLRALELQRLARKLPPVASHAAERPGARFSGRSHSLRRDGQAVRYHYDTGNGFFGQFLDPHMVYSCAYFLSPDESLADAQRRKLDLICRKLGLLAGDRFLDVGCGWGALVVHAALEFGVHATGITLSAEQAEAARLAAQRAGVERNVTILQRDYRALDGQFDAIASVGMFEHVGNRQLPEYYGRLRKLLAPGGSVLNHGIVSRDRHRPLLRRPSFISTYVFPDGELRPIEEAVKLAESAGLELRDVETLRMSYALTLRRWVANLESNRAGAVKAAGEQTYRIWRAYMAGSAIAFENGAISVYQMLLSDPVRPWSYGRASLLAADDPLFPRSGGLRESLRAGTKQAR